MLRKKLEEILARSTPEDGTIETDPDPHRIRRLLRLTACLRHHVREVIFAFERRDQPEIYRLRCPFKRNCPWCLRTENIARTRAKDAEALQEANVIVGGNHNGEGTAVWVVEYQGNDTVPTPRQLSERLTRNGGRHRPLLTKSSRMAGEVFSICATHKAISYIALIVAQNGAKLDAKRLLPNCIISRFHNNLRAGWLYYLSRCADSLEARTVEQIEAQVVSKDRERIFHAIGELRGLVSRERKDYTEHLHATKGKGHRLTSYTLQEHKTNPKAVIERSRDQLDNLADVFSPIRRARILKTLEVQMRSVDGSLSALLKRKLESEQKTREVLTADMAGQQAMLREAKRMHTELNKLRKQLANVTSELQQRNTEQERWEHEQRARGPKRVE